MSDQKGKRTLEDMAHAVMPKHHKRFVKACGGRENDFTNGYTWGFADGFKVAMRKRKQP